MPVRPEIDLLPSELWVVVGDNCFRIPALGRDRVECIRHPLTSSE